MPTKKSLQTCLSKVGIFLLFWNDDDDDGYYGDGDGGGDGDEEPARSFIKGGGDIFVKPEHQPLPLKYMTAIEKCMMMTMSMAMMMVELPESRWRNRLASFGLPVVSFHPLACNGCIKLALSLPLACNRVN